MLQMEWWIWISIAGFILLSLIAGAIIMLSKTIPIAKWVYNDQLVKTDPEKWGRVCSCPENQEQLTMWNEGISWASQYQDKKTELHIIHDGLNLYGEFYRLNDSKKCVFIIPGRCESLLYSYYFAPPYDKAGYNVLVVDARAHVKSDGTRNTVGVKESGDILAWLKFATQELEMEEIVFHTICIGTASALLAMTSPDCPPQVNGLVTEGCFTSFAETFRQHMIQLRRPTFPVLQLAMHQIKKHTGTNVYKAAPIRIIREVKQRVLFLYGEKDVFSLPPKSRKLFAACGSNDKQLVWFEKGSHSHLRINNQDQYDQFWEYPHIYKRR